MNAYRKASNEYATWIDNLLHAYADRHRVEWQDAENYICFNGLSITFSFDHKAICRRKSALSDSSAYKLSLEFDNVDRFYKKVLRGLLGRTYANKREQQPLIIAAADINGTRVSARPEAIENMHVHSLWLFPPGKKNALAAVREKALQDNRFDFRDIHVDEIARLDASPGQASKLASYTAKFLGSNAVDMRLADDLRIYPLQSDGTALIHANDNRPD